MTELRADKVPVYGIWKYAVPRSLKEADWLESALLTSGSVRLNEIPGSGDQQHRNGDGLQFSGT